MSADSFIPLAVAGAFFVAGPLVLTGVAVAGAAAAVSVIAHAAADSSRQAGAVRARRQREQQARLARQSAEDQKAIRELQSYYTALKDRQHAAADQLSQRIAQAAQEAARELQASSKVTAENAAALRRKAQARAEALTREWSAQNDALLAKYSADLHASFQNVILQVEDCDELMSRINFSVDCRRQIIRAAKAELDAARAAIKTFEVEFGRSPADAVENYNRAVEYYKNHIYNNAFSLASDVTLDVRTQIEKALVQQEKDDFLRSTIRAMVQTGQAHIHALENASVPYQGSEYLEDLTRFTPGIFAALKARLQQQEETLNNASSAELAKARADVSELLQDIDSTARTAARQMVYAYNENDAGELIQQAMSRQGYTCTGYAYKHSIEGQPMHINFEKALTGEHVTVELAPDEHGVAVSLHNFGCQAGGVPTDARVQDALCNELVAALNQSGALRAPCHASCSGRGVTSSATQAADLHAVSR